MKNIMNRWLLLFVLLLGLSALACNLPFGGEEEATLPASEGVDSTENEGDVVEETAVPDVPAVTETEEDPVATPEPAEEPTEEAEGGLLSNLFPQSVIVRDTVQELAVLDTYQMNMEITTTVSETTQVISATILISTNPAQSFINFTFEGAEDMGGMGNMSMTQIEDTSYMIIPDFGCITTPASEAQNTFSDTLDANQFLNDVGEATLVGEETINGIETLHYTFDETAMQAEMSQFNWAQGDVYIAKEGNYVVRFRIEGEGAVNDVGVAVLEGSADDTNPIIGLMVIQMDVTNINEPVEITIPAECENSGMAASDYPMLEDAYDSSSFGGIISYKTDTSFADAVAFYQESLPAAGWVYQESESFIMDGTTALMYFKQDDRSLTVTITEETGSAAFNVVLFEE